MKRILNCRIAAFTLVTILVSSATSGAATNFPSAAKISVAVDQPGHRIAPTLWGIFFEDINMSTDGGIYPEMVRNRSFEDADTPENWKFISIGAGRSTATISTADMHAHPPPLNAFNRKSLCVKADGELGRRMGRRMGCILAGCSPETAAQEERGDG